MIGSKFLRVSSESESFLRVANTGFRIGRIKRGGLRLRQLVSAETYPEPWVSVMRVGAKAEAGFDRVINRRRNRLPMVACRSRGCEVLSLG